MKWLFAVLFFIGSLGIAQLGCQSTKSVETVGYAPSGSQTSEGLNEALAEALANAVAEARGVFISSKATLVEVAKSSFANATADVSNKSRFEESIERLFSGTLTGYKVLGQQTRQDGILEVRVSAQVCMEPVVAVISDDRFNAGLVAALGDALTGTGWKVRPLNVSGAFTVTPETLIRLALPLGATYVAQFSITPTSRESAGAIAVQLAASVTLYDLRSLSSVSSANFDVSGTAFNNMESLNRAISQLSRTVAQSWYSLYSSTHTVSKIAISNVRRSASQYLLRDMVQGLPGVLRVLQASYNSERQEVTLELDVSRPICEIADALTRVKRILTKVSSCQNSEARLWILQE